MAAEEASLCTAGSTVASALPGRTIRVLLIAPSLAITGGQSVQAIRLIDELRREPFLEVDFLALDQRLPVYLRNIPYLRTLFNAIFYYAQLIWRAPKYDILHVFSASYWSYTLWSMPPILVGRLLGKKVIMNYRSGEAEDHLSNWPSAPITLRWANMLVAPSEYLVDVFARFGLSMRFVYNILDFDRFRHRSRKRLRPNFFTNRGLEPLYNVGCVIRAFGHIQQTYPEAALTLAHDGSCRPELENLVKQLNLQNVTFIGYVSQAQMPELYDAADIYLMSPDLDCMPGTVLECFASGIPLVSTDAGGIPYIVQRGETGLLVPCGDDKALAAEAMRLLEDPSLVERLTGNAYGECEKYRGDVVRREWSKIYSGLLPGHLK